MDLRAPDPLNSVGDELYALYRRGILRRHIASNGRFLESIALESIDNATDVLASNPQYIEVIHSAPGGELGPKTRIRVPYGAVRYSMEVDTAAPTPSGRYAVAPALWVPHVAPIKYPGIPNFERRLVQSSPAPWLPQAYSRKALDIPEWYYVASCSRADNPCYYGGMALAALSLEHIHGVSSVSLQYARKLVEGFLAHEMNGRNGYMIRHDRWHTVSGSVKKLRGGGAEELLGLMLGIMFYLRAESPNHPLAVAATGLRDRVLDKVSRGSSIGSAYEHPFMADSFPLKQFEWALYASTNEERGREWYYRNLLTERAGTTASIGDALAEFFAGEGLDFFDFSMYLTSMILVLEGGLPRSKKEWYAGIFMEDFIKAAYIAGPNRADLRKNAYMGVLARLCNKYLNNARDSHYVGNKLREIWDDHMAVWDEVTTFADRRIAQCRSIDNDLVAFNDDDQWQHNLPLYTIVDADDTTLVPWPGVWRAHNPHRRIGAHFEWHHRYPQWFRGSKSRFGIQALGFGNGAALSELEYAQSDAKRFSDAGFLEREISAFRGHHNFQIEGCGIGLVFLRMLLTHINPDIYPPPVLPDADVVWPIMPFLGVEPLEPRFLNYSHHFRSTDQDWNIGGDKDKALNVLAFPSRSLVITASADDDDILSLDAWRLREGRFDLLYWRRDDRFDQVVLRKTSSIRDPNVCDTLIVAERAEEGGIVDDHWLRVSIYRVSSNGTLSKLASADVSDVGSSAAQEIDLCILDYRFAAVTFKTHNDLARVKVLELDFANSSIVERVAIDAEHGTDAPHDEIGDFIWIGSAHDRVIVNAYRRSADPYYQLEIFSHVWAGGVIGTSTRHTMSVSRDMPIAGTMVSRGATSFLLMATFDPIQADGEEFGSFVLSSWEVQPTGQLVFRGRFERPAEWDQKYLLRSSGYHFERMSMRPARFKRPGEFVIAAKGSVGKGDGIILLYGYVTGDGMPTLLDWNCLGSGDDDSAQMVSVCGDATADGQFGAVVASKEKDDGLSLTWWRFGEDFQLSARYRRDPGIRIKKDPPPSRREVDY